MTDDQFKDEEGFFIWPKEAKEPFVIGEYDEKTGKVIRDYVIQPGERVPREAIILWRKAMAEGKNPTEIPFDMQPFRGFYERERAEIALKKQ